MKLEAGAEIGPYRVVRLIGAGEMGEVYRAHDPRLSRDVALKVLPDHIAANPDMVARFEREVRAVAALSHPNVLAIHDIGETDGLIYAVMEYVPGVTLRARLAGGPLPLGTVVNVATQIARGLEAAHAKQIVHRDLKPENVLVSDAWHVKILDFGLAKLAPLAGTETQHATQFETLPGVVMGTLAYMAPEQVRGLAIDHRADIFSFGAMVYEMLAARPPFLRATPAETIAALLSAEGADPAAISSMPALLGRLVARCLTKPVAERLDSLTEAIELLADRSSGDVRPSAAVTPGASQPVLRSIAVLPFADMTAARDQDYFCEGMADEIITALTRVSGLRVVARTSAFRFKNRTDDVRDIGRALGVDTLLEGSVRVAGRRLRVTAQLVNTSDGYQVWSERFDRDVDDVFAVQDEIASTVRRVLTSSLTSQLRMPEASSSSALASHIEGHAPRPASLDVYTAYLRGRHHWNRRTETGLEQSVACFREALAGSPHYAPAWAALADSYVTLAIYGLRPPAEVMPLAREAANAALAASPMLAGAHAALGSVLALHDWSWDDAQAAFGRALEIDPNSATAHQWRAMHLLLPLGRMDEAAEALALARELEPMSPAIGASLGLRALFAGDLEGSLTHLNRALDADPDAAVLQFVLGMTLTERGELAAALAAFDRAGQLGGPRPELTAARAQAQAKAGDRAGALAAIAEFRVVAGTRFVSPATVAQVHAALDDVDSALDALDRAADVRATDLVWLNVRPVFKPMRAHPRFQALVTRLRL